MYKLKAVWSTSAVNDLPDSAFLYIESGGTKDESNKTTPRGLRHFPYKDDTGAIDLPHLRNALARIPQSKLPADVKARLTKRATQLLSTTRKEYLKTKSLALKAPSYGAKVGGVIAGALGRGQGGRFVRVGTPQSQRRRMIDQAFAKGGKGGKKGSGSKKLSASSQDSLASSLGLNQGASGALRDFAKGVPISDAQSEQLRKSGLLRQVGGKDVLAPNARSLIAALARGDKRAAEDALTKAGAAANKPGKQPKAPGGGSGGGQSAAAQAAAARAAQRKTDADKRQAQQQTQDLVKAGRTIEEIDAAVTKIDDADAWDKESVQAVRLSNRLQNLRDSITAMDKVPGPDKDKVLKRLDETLKRFPQAKTQGGADSSAGDRVSSANRRNTVMTQSVKEAGLLVFKDKTNKSRWVTYSSNAFKDRENEIVSLAALQRGVARMDATKQYGPLRFWHIGEVVYKEAGVWDSAEAGPGADLGTCDFSCLVGPVLVESGTFKDESIAEYVAKSASRLEVSSGFTHPPGEPDTSSGLYTDAKFVERSILPAGRAANALTGVLSFKELLDMNIDQKKMVALKDLLGGDATALATVLAGVDQITAKAKTDGLQMKELLQSDDGKALAKSIDELPPPVLKALKEFGMISEEKAGEGDQEPDPNDPNEPTETDEPSMLAEMTMAEFKQAFVDPIVEALKALSQGTKAIADTTAKSIESQSPSAEMTKALKEIKTMMVATSARLKALEGGAPAGGKLKSESTDEDESQDTGFKPKSYGDNKNKEYVTEDERLAAFWMTPTQPTA